MAFGDYGNVGMAVDADLRQGVTRGKKAISMGARTHVLGIVCDKESDATDLAISKATHFGAVFRKIVVAQNGCHGSVHFEFSQDAGVADIPRVNDMVAFRQGRNGGKGQCSVGVRDYAYKHEPTSARAIRYASSSGSRMLNAAL